MRKIFALLVLCAAAGSALSQVDNKARDAAYSQCIAASPHAETKYKACQDYLDKYPADDYQHRDAAEKLVLAFERVTSYAKALQTFVLTQRNSWFVYEPDLKIDLPNIEEKKSNYSIKIERLFNNASEAAMLKKAEAVYGPQSSYIGEMTRSPWSWADQLPDEITPLWGRESNDNVILCEVITASAVQYYYLLSLSAREHRRFRRVFLMVSTGLKYTASIKHYDEWEHHAVKYRDVYIADLNLEWSSICGGLCGIGFAANKLVVLDKQGNVVELFVENGRVWES